MRGWTPTGCLPPEQSWRDVDYGYLELYAPLVSRSAQRIGLNELNFDVAGRYERYSDSAALKTLPSVSNTSRFRNLHSRRHGANHFARRRSTTCTPAIAITCIRRAQAGGQPGTELLIAGGSNPRLQPETAKSWNTTVEYTPPIHGLAVTMNCFDILYRDRINLPFTNLLTALSGPHYRSFHHSQSERIYSTGKHLASVLVFHLSWLTV